MTKKPIITVLIMAFVGALLLKTFVFEGLIVSGDSMSPTIQSGDYIFINRLAYVWTEPQRGDIIVGTPREMSTMVIKRVVGTPGEVVKLEGGFKTNIDPQEYFVMGDNRNVSVDSVEFGGIDKWSIKGKVIFGLRLSKLKYLRF